MVRDPEQKPEREEENWLRVSRFIVLSKVIRDQKVGENTIQNRWHSLPYPGDSGRWSGAHGVACGFIYFEGPTYSLAYASLTTKKEG